VSIQKSVHRFEKDAVLITEGQPANNEMYFLVRGTAIVELRGNVVGKIHAGEWFGELAAILGGNRTATVRSVTPCEVLLFRGLADDHLYDAMAKDPKMIRKLIEQLAHRLVETSKRHSSESGELTAQSMRYRRAISGTLYALERLAEKYKSKVMEETREHLAGLSGVPTGQAADTDPRFFTTSHPAIFGG